MNHAMQISPVPHVNFPNFSDIDVTEDASIMDDQGLVFDDEANADERMLALASCLKNMTQWAELSGAPNVRRALEAYAEVQCRLSCEVRAKRVRCQKNQAADA